MKTLKEFESGLARQERKISEAEISTTNYQFSHGKKPSGFGTWAFDFYVNGKWETEFHPGQANYSDAKKWAVKRAKELGALRVRVGT